MDVYYPDAAVGIEIIPDPEEPMPAASPEDAVTLYVAESQLGNKHLVKALFSLICLRAEERAGASAGDKAAGGATTESRTGDKNAVASNGHAQAAEAGKTVPNRETDTTASTNATNRNGDGNSSPGARLAELIANGTREGAFPYDCVVGEHRAVTGHAAEKAGNGRSNGRCQGGEDFYRGDPYGLEEDPMWSYEEWLENCLDAASTYPVRIYDPEKQPFLNVGSCKNLYLNV